VAIVFINNEQYFLEYNYIKYTFLNVEIK